MDAEIQSQCDQLIDSLSLLPNEKPSSGREFLPRIEKNPPSSENTKALKAVLSYYRSLFPDRHEFTQAEYCFAISIVYALNPILTK